MSRWNLALGLLAVGCAKSTAIIATDQSECEVSPAVIAEAPEIQLDDLQTLSAGAVATYADDEQQHFVELGPDAMPTVSQAVASAVGFQYPSIVPEPAGGFRVAFQNHFVAGQWRVYVARFDSPADSLDWAQSTVASDTGAESFRPKIATLGGRLGVAYWYRRSVAAAVVDTDGLVLTQTILPEGRENPLVRSILPVGDGFLVYATRWRTEPMVGTLSHFRLDGSAIEGPEEEGAQGELRFAPSGRIVLIVVTNSGIDFRPIDSSGAPTETPQTIAETEGAIGLDVIVTEAGFRLLVQFDSGELTDFTVTESGEVRDRRTLSTIGVAESLPQVIAMPNAGLSAWVESVGSGQRLVAAALCE